jgi:hypothetical protein
MDSNPEADLQGKRIYAGCAGVRRAGSRGVDVDSRSVASESNRPVAMGWVQPVHHPR